MGIYHEDKASLREELEARLDEELRERDDLLRRIKHKMRRLQKGFAADDLPDYLYVLQESSCIRADHQLLQKTNEMIRDLLYLLSLKDGEV